MHNVFGKGGVAERNLEEYNKNLDASCVQTSGGDNCARLSENVASFTGSETVIKKIFENTWMLSVSELQEMRLLNSGKRVCSALSTCLKKIWVQIVRKHRKTNCAQTSEIDAS